MAIARTVAVAGMIAAFTAVQIFPFLDPSGAAPDAAAAAAPEVVPVLPLAAILAFFAAVASVHVRIRNAGGGAGDRRRIPDLVIFFLTVCIGILMGMDVDGGVKVQVPALGVVAFHALVPFATFMFFMATALIYAAAAAAGGGGGNTPIPTYVALLTNMTLAATLVTFMAVALACYTI